MIALDGVSPQQGLRVCRTGELGAGDVHGRYLEACLRQGVYSAQVAAANPTGVSTGILAAGGTPLLLVWNPAGTGKLLSVIHACVAVRSCGTTSPGSFVWTGGITAAITANTSAPTNIYTFQKTGSVALFVPNLAATGVSALNFIRPIMGIGAPTAAATAGFGTGFEDTAGSILIPPGCAAGIISTVSGVVSVIDAGIIWEELPFIS